MTDAPFTETHRETLTRLLVFSAQRETEAIAAALAEIDRLTRELAAALRHISKMEELEAKLEAQLRAQETP